MLSMGIAGPARKRWIYEKEFAHAMDVLGVHGRIGV
jgi:hypothetical protein